MGEMMVEFDVRLRDVHGGTAVDSPGTSSANIIAGMDVDPGLKLRRDPTINTSPRIVEYTET